MKKSVLEFIKHSKERMTPLAAEKHFISAHPEWSKEIVAHLIKELVTDGDLTFTYELGSSFLEPSFNKPVRVSDHVVIKPERVVFSTAEDDIVITLQEGASFGSGRHPSTRLALRAMERVLMRSNDITNENQMALDIGTGSGALAIAAVFMGIKKVIALDIDPCARSEATHNIQLNGLTKRVVIDHRRFESIHETFFLVLANLRLPTLSGLHQGISDILESNGFAVFSGLKTEEIGPIENVYQKVKMPKQFTFTEKDWASIVFRKRAE